MNIYLPTSEFVKLTPSMYDTMDIFYILKSYVFDLDQNLLHTKTPIYLLIKQPDGSRVEEAIPNSEFETRLQDTTNVKFHDDIQCSLRDFHWYDKLLTDTFDAIYDKAYGPSWQKFTTATIEAAPTHIITARANPQEAFRAMHRKFIYEILDQAQQEEMAHNMNTNLHSNIHDNDKLIDIYLNNNLYIPCANPHLIKTLRWWNKTGEEKKGLAFEKCVKQTLATYTSYHGKQFMKNRNISIWFSDDSTKNVDAVMQTIMKRLVQKYPNISFMLYNTQEPTIIKKEIIQSTTI